jgi:glutamate decarboxylase
MLNLTRTADYLSANLENLGFVIMSQRGGEGLPLVAARIDEDLGKMYDEFAVYVLFLFPLPPIYHHIILIRVD